MTRPLAERRSSPLSVPGRVKKFFLKQCISHCFPFVTSHRLILPPLPKGRAGIAWEPSKPFFRLVRVVSVTVPPLLSFFFPLRLFDMYMSYRWRESFNTVRSPSDSWRHHKGDWHVWAQNAERREGGWTIHPSRRWLINCARAAVLYVCLSIALTSCTTSMAETNLDAIRKQKTRNILKDMDWNEKWKCNSKRPRLQKPNQKNYKYSFCLMVQASDHVYVLPRTYTCHTDLPAKNITGT